MPAAWIQGGLALGGALGLFGGSSGGGGGQQAGYVPTGLNSADTGWQHNQSTNQSQLGYGGGFASQVDPAMMQAWQQMQGIDYNPYLQQMQGLGQQYGAADQMMMQQAMGNFGQQQNLQGAGQQLFNMGMDPQQELYNRTQHQVQDQSAATNSMYGMGASGQGAALQNQAMGNFNIDWQNQQLQRASQGLQGMIGADREAGAYGTLGSADMQAALGYGGQSANVPLQAQQMVAGMPMQNAQQYAQAMGAAMSPYQQQQNMATQYMGYGSTAGSNNFQNQLAANQQMQGQLQGLGSSLGQVPWGQLSGLFGGGNTGTGIDPYGYLGGASTAGDYSDARLKTDVVHLGIADNGLPMYSFRYVWGGPEQIGHMAHEVATKFPDAVTADANGYLMVDYSKV